MTGAGTCDPFAVVTRIATEAGKKPHVIGKTEVMPNTQSPTWAKTFSFDYELGSPCRLAVSVYHKTSGGESSSMGAAIFDVGKVLGARGSTKAKKLKGGGTLYVHARKASGAGTFRFKFRGEKVSKCCPSSRMGFVHGKDDMDALSFKNELYS
jgi:hypothetical protein